MSSSALFPLDQGLYLLRDLSPEYGEELSNHAPMVLEALDRLGHPDMIGPFLVETLPKLRRLGAEPEPGLRNYAELRAEAVRDLASAAAEDVLLRWFPRYAPGLAGAAFHGLIRVGHAFRSLARGGDRPAEASVELRSDELAKALAYAAVRSEPLPLRATPRSGRGLDLQQALRDTVPSSEALSRRSGLISTALARRAGGHPTLAECAALLVLPDDPITSLRQLRSAAVDLLLQSEYLPLDTFTMLHAVTGMDAALTVGRALPYEAGRSLARHAAHALLAMRVAFVGRFPFDSPRQPAPAFELLAERSVRSLDDHAIKLAAALAAARADLGEERCAQALSRWVDKIAPSAAGQ